MLACCCHAFLHGGCLGRSTRSFSCPQSPRVCGFGGEVPRDSSAAAGRLGWTLARCPGSRGDARRWNQKAAQLSPREDTCWEVFAHHHVHLLCCCYVLLCYQGLLIYSRSGKIRLCLGCLAARSGNRAGVHPKKVTWLLMGIAQAMGTCPACPEFCCVARELRERHSVLVLTYCSPCLTGLWTS